MTASILNSISIIILTAAVIFNSFTLQLLMKRIRRLETQLIDLQIRLIELGHRPRHVQETGELR